jgi:hypothetical protein
VRHEGASPVLRGRDYSDIALLPVYTLASMRKLYHYIAYKLLVITNYPNQDSLTSVTYR